jgi:hypothetical protein
VSTLAIDQFNLAVSAMITRLQGVLPPGNSTLSVLQADEQPVGVGNWQGNVERGPLSILGLRGGRVAARVRFELREANPQDVSAAVLQLQLQLRGARTNPLFRDFLVLEPDGGEPAAPLANNDWRQTAEYRVLFEYRYEDPEEAGSLIVRIPVDLRGEHHEDDLVTRDLTRWDREGAPPLVVRGPRTLDEITLLVHLDGPAPAGQVRVRRTFDGAPPPGAFHVSRAAFAAAVLPPSSSRNEELRLPNVQALVDTFAPAGDDVRLARLPDVGDPPDQRVPASFDPRATPGLRGMRMASRAERLEISYQFPAGFPGGSRAVLYLRAGRGPSA